MVKRTIKNTADTARPPSLIIHPSNPPPSLPPPPAFLGASTHAGIPSPLTLDARSLDPASPPPTGLTPVPGTLWLVNSAERFKAFDRAAAVRACVAATAAEISSAPAAADPARVGARFVLLAYADLKSYKFTHWVAVPALVPRPGQAPWRGLRPAGVEGVEGAGGPSTAPPPPFSFALDYVLGREGAAAVASACDTWRGVGGGSGGGTGGPRPSHPPAWLVTPPAPPTSAPSAAPSPSSSRAAPLSAWGALASSSPPAHQPWLAFDDPSGDAGAPGWPLRNLLALVSSRPGFFTPRPAGLTILAVRPQAGGRACPTACRVLRVALPAAEAGAAPLPSCPPHVAGWECNARGRPGPRTASLAGALDPVALAAGALALNLRLMRWRAAPTLDPATISSARFLLLGAGTLGCGAARALLGWGATALTLVDCGRVSFSNPPRQPLFEHADCLGGGAPKAAAAAAALKRVFPGSQARGVDLAIPMPGHLAPRACAADPAWADARAGVEALAALVEDADVVFLLTDTRESRWLPSLLVAADGWRRSSRRGGRSSPLPPRRPPKLAITAALGFDTFVVMRHGVHAAAGAGGVEEGVGAEDGGAAEPGGGPDAPPPPRLGCYFCSDVVAPGDSTADRALDQQCTIARPGLAPIASALAVELAAAVLTHPAGAGAPPGEADPLAPALPLGPAPHMLRGRLGGGFSQTAMTGPASAVCTACSPPVLQAYADGGVGWVLEALADPRGPPLEGVSGLTALHAAMDAREAGEAGGEEEEEEEEGGGVSGEDGEEEAWTEL